MGTAGRLKTGATARLPTRLHWPTLDNMRTTGTAARAASRIEYGETFYDLDGTAWHQVFEYEGGQCVDRYVSRAGVQL